MKLKLNKDYVFYLTWGDVYFSCFREFYFFFWYIRKDVGGWTILKWILEGWDGMDWIDLAQDRDQ
jgi:hypothetical protein